MILRNIMIIITFRRLLNYEGSLMAFAGKSDKKENVTAAIAANIWMSHERGGRTALPDETLNFIVLDCLVSLIRNTVDPLHFGHSLALLMLYLFVDTVV